ncbi:MAG: nitroreductase family protein [Thermoproteota archaeon]
MSGCLAVISGHASVREYTGDPIPREDLEKIIEAARRAPTGWNLQPITVIAVLDAEKKRRLAEILGGQQHIASSAAFLVFAVDYAKILRAAEAKGVKFEPKLSNVVEGLVDAGIASGWAALAAESLGYGVTFIAVYWRPCQVAEVLGLPKYVVPAVGLTIGRPASKPAPKKRQSREAFADVDSYGSAEAKAKAVLEVYGEKAERLFREVLFGPEGYYEEFARNMRACLEEKGFRV